MRHPIVIPDLGATGGDVRIVSWAVREGQTVKEGETLFTVETDKAVTEIPAFRGGALVSISVAAFLRRLHPSAPPGAPMRPVAMPLRR